MIKIQVMFYHGGVNALCPRFFRQFRCIPREIRIAITRFTFRFRFLSCLGRGLLLLLGLLGVVYRFPGASFPRRFLDFHFGAVGILLGLFGLAAALLCRLFRLSWGGLVAGLVVLGDVLWKLLLRKNHP